MAYQEVIDNPGIADARLALAWAHESGRLGPTSRKFSNMTQATLNVFAGSHGLPPNYYTLDRVGREYFLESHPRLAPNGADPRSAAAQRIQLPAGWGRLYAQAAYQTVIDLPTIADTRLALAWAHETGRLSGRNSGIDKLGPAVLNDFAAAHGLPRDSYTLVYDGRGSVYSAKSYLLQSHPDRFPNGADPNLVAPNRINPPDDWGRTYQALAYQEVIDDPGIADARLALAWARETGRLPDSGRIDRLSQEMVADFAAAHGLPPGAYTLTYDGRGSVDATKSYLLQAHPEHFPNGADWQYTAAEKIPLPVGWGRLHTPMAYQEVIDNPGIADARLALAWARETGRLLGDHSPGLERLSQAVLSDFSAAHGLPNDYYTLTYASHEYFLESHPERSPYGANMTQAAAQKIDLPDWWGRLHTPMAYQEVIDNPGIADARLALAWAHETGRLAASTGVRGMSPSVLNDFAASHGLPAGSYTLARNGRGYSLQAHPDRFPYGADQGLTAPSRIGLPANWGPNTPNDAQRYDQAIDPPDNRSPTPNRSALPYSEPSGQYADYPPPQGDLAQNPYAFASAADFYDAGSRATETTMMASGTNPYVAEASSMPPLSQPYSSGYDMSAPYGVNQPTTYVSQNTGYSGSSGQQAAISYTTEQMGSMSITSDSWQANMAGIQSSLAPSNRQDEYSFDEPRQPTPEQGRRKHRRRR
ncbi:hypothetical protein [Micromonospora ureilytica]|uniref:hypothetical protein n=1 Tax=Micromonospora ureilytica TaxID=709868 RepID=UPI002E1577C2|nr:hypothetical protein OHB55_18245 [Micromonospora ureilytica]